MTGSSADGSRKEMIRLDPATGEVVARIPVRAVPGWEFGGARLTVAEGGVWLVDTVGGGPTCCHAFVTRIDPSTNEVADAFEVPGEVAFGADIWVEEGSAYVLSFVQGGSALELTKVDVATHEVAWRTPVPGQWSQTVFVADGSVWVLGTAPDAHGPIEVTTWYRFDPVTGAPLAELPLPQSTYIPAQHGDAVWARTEDGVQLFDATSGEPIGDPVQPGPGCCTGPFVSDGAGGVWVVSSPGSGLDRSIWHIDASGTIAERGTIEDTSTYEEMLGQSYALDPGTRTIWVQHYEDSIARVGLEPAGAEP